MKKLWMALLFSVLLFVGCTAGENSSSEPGSQPAPSSQAEESSSQAEEIDPAVREMMEALAGYQPGTAGSSLKVYIAACGVLDYAEEYDAAKEETLRVMPLPGWPRPMPSPGRGCWRGRRQSSRRQRRSCPAARRARPYWPMPAIPTGMRATTRNGTRL